MTLVMDGVVNEDDSWGYCAGVWNGMGLDWVMGMGMGMGIWVQDDKGHWWKRRWMDIATRFWNSWGGGR